MRVVLNIILVAFSFGLFAQNQSLFEEGNTLYNKGQYAGAIEKYETIVADGQHSAEVYFNLANAHYKLNNIAPSIYFYEKALQLKPNDTEIKNNRAFAQNMTIDAFGETPKVGFSRLFNKVIKYFNYDTWAFITIGLMMLFVGLYLLYYFSYSSNRKRLAFVFSLLSLVLALVTLSLAFQRYGLDKKDNPAIVFAQESKLKSGPNTSSDEVLRIHEGTKVQVLEDFNEWRKVELTNGTVGWVPLQDIKLLKDI